MLQPALSEVNRTIFAKEIVRRSCESISSRDRRHQRIPLLLWTQMYLNELKSREKEPQLWVNQDCDGTSYK